METPVLFCRREGSAAGLTAGPHPHRIYYVPIMSYDLKAFCRDLQDRLNWLFKEVVRLQEENDRLLEENQSLREEATLSRLVREMGEKERPPIIPREMPSRPPNDMERDTVDFYRTLPSTFSFSDYFEAADAHGLSASTARDWMLIFFRENMLEQRGRTIEKHNNQTFPVRMVR